MFVDDRETYAFRQRNLSLQINVVAAFGTTEIAVGRTLGVNYLWSMLTTQGEHAEILIVLADQIRDLVVPRTLEFAKVVVLWTLESASCCAMDSRVGRSSVIDGTEMGHWELQA